MIDPDIGSKAYFSSFVIVRLLSLLAIMFVVPLPFVVAESSPEATASVDVKWDKTVAESKTALSIQVCGERFPLSLWAHFLQRQPFFLVQSAD